MPEERAPISSSRLTAGELPRHSFSTVRRGFDPQEVRNYLEMVAREFAAFEQRDAEIHQRLREAEERAAHPVIDEAALTAALGQQSARLLRNAHEEAQRITERAEARAAALLREAQREATELQVGAESSAGERIAEAELAVNAIQAQAQHSADATVESARAEAEAMVAQAREQGRAMVEEAQLARKRVLGDMAARRRGINLQIERLRAARDQLAMSVLTVREAVDQIVGGLAHADDAARAAAAEVAARQAPLLEAEASAGAELVLDPVTDELLLAASPPAGSAAPVESAPPDPEVELVDEEAIVAPGAEDEGATGGEAAPGADAPADGGETQVVEELFARIRASSAPGERAPRQGDAEVVTAAATGDAPASASASASAPAQPESVPEMDEEAAVDDALVGRQAELLDPVVVKLARKVKRALQDDQNRLLERLRSGSGEWSEDLLADEAVQRASLVEATSAALHEAARAGVVFAQRESGGSTRAKVVLDDAQVEGVAEALAQTVTTLLRRRLAADDSDASERVGAAYREWRGERIERLVGDHAVSAFSIGVLASAARGSDVRWVLGPTSPACADCDDNSLGGAVAPGEEFPTGHRHPPAHAGCRCLVVPTPKP
jgi:DivIVA domain-containing protein